MLTEVPSKGRLIVDPHNKNLVLYCRIMDPQKIPSLWIHTTRIPLLQIHNKDVVIVDPHNKDVIIVDPHNKDVVIVDPHKC